MFLRACVIQRRAGKLDKKRFARLKQAVWSGLHYTVALDANPNGLKRRSSFIGHLREEVANIHPDKQVAAGLLFGDDEDPGILDGLFDTFNFQELFNSLTNWMIENWPDILKIAITLLIFLDAAEQVEE